MPYRTWPKFAYTNLLLQNSTHSRKEIKTLWKKIRKDVVDGPSIVFTRKAVIDETFIRKSANIFKATVAIDASQLYPYSMCQLMPTGLYKRWDFDSETTRFTPRQNKTRSVDNIVMSYFQRTRPNVKLKASFQQTDIRKLTASVFMGFVIIATLYLKPCVAFTTSVPVKSCVFLSLKKIFNVVARKASSMY